MSGPFQVVLLPGDGAGVEVMHQARRVLDRAAETFALQFDLEEIPCGGQYYLQHGRDWPEGSERRCAAADLILLGAVGWPDPQGTGPVTMKDGRMAGWNPVIGNRLRLDLYANIRPVKLYDGVEHRISGRQQRVWRPEHVDMVFLRENTEDLYVGAGTILRPANIAQVATDTRIITRRASERIIRLAFQTANRRSGAPKDGQKRVTAVVKNNVLDGCRMFTEIFGEVAREFPDVEPDVAIVDAFTQWLITEPERYDVVVTTNMFGDIITDLASVLQGGMGMAVGCNVGDQHGMFEPIHGTAPPFAGQDRLNPMAMIGALAEGLRWLGARRRVRALQSAATAIEGAIRDVLSAGEPLTFDLVGEDRCASMSAVTDAIVSRL